MADGQNTVPGSGSSTFSGAGNPLLETLASLNEIAQGVGTTAGNIFDTVSSFKQNLQIKKLERKNANSPPPATVPSFQMTNIAQWLSDPMNKRVALVVGALAAAALVFTVSKKRK